MLIDTYSRKTGISKQIDDSELEKREGRDERCDWVEYWLDGECVHRSATAQATGVQAVGIAAKLPMAQ